MSDPNGYHEVKVFGPYGEPHYLLPPGWKVHHSEWRDGCFWIHASLWHTLKKERPVSG